MRRTVLTLAAVSLLIAAAPSATYAKGPLHANVLSMPSALAPGEAVPVVFELYVLDHASTMVPVGGSMSEVAIELVPVTVAGEAETQRFRADHLGDGRYAAEIVFTAAGGWALRVTTELRLPAVPLGKGAVHVPAQEAEGGAAARRVPAAWLLLAFLPIAGATAALVGRRSASGRAPATP